MQEGKRLYRSKQTKGKGTGAQICTGIVVMQLAGSDNSVWWPLTAPFTELSSLLIRSWFDSSMLPLIAFEQRHRAPPQLLRSKSQCHAALHLS